jgi:predicted transcriptional regulator
MKSKSKDLTRRERHIMDAVYAAGEASAAEIRAAMPDPPSYSAVRAFLRILVDKGLLRHRLEGTKYVYVPTKARRHAARSTVRKLVATFFRGSVEDAVATLLSTADRKLTKEQSQRLSALIDKATEDENQ